MRECIMKGNLISIIIPVFNSEKTLKKCISSILSQSYKNLDIIIINDGSTDNSDEICKDYQKKDKRINYIIQKNSGVSSARNNGLSNAKGDFITFIDSDDWVEEDYIESLINLLIKNNADVITSSAIDFTDDKIINTPAATLKYEITTNKETMIRDLLEAKKYNSVCWGNIYRKSIIKGLKFNKNLKIAEDLDFLISVFERCDKLIVTNIRKYHYYINDGSTIHSGFNNNWIGAINFNKKLIDKYKRTDLEIYAVKNYVITNLSCLYSFKLKKSDKLFIRKNIKKYKKIILFNNKFGIKLKIKFILSFFR